MARKIKVSELAEFDPAKYATTTRRSPTTSAWPSKTGIPGCLRLPLGEATRARGMTQVAQAAGLAREALYIALRPEAHPRFDTIQKVCRALGVKLTAALA